MYELHDLFSGGDYHVNGLDGTSQKGVLLTDQSAAVGTDLAIAKTSL